MIVINNSINMGSGKIRHSGSGITTIGSRTCSPENLQKAADVLSQAGFETEIAEDIQHIIAKLKYKNIGVIITDHNVGETLAIIDRAYLLYEGNILQQGTPEDLAADEEVRTKYLGSGFVLKRSSAFAEIEQQLKQNKQ